MRVGLLRTLITLACVSGAAPYATSQENSGQPLVPAATQQEMPDFVRRGQRGPGHAALEPLEGTWQVEMSLYIAGGTPDSPVVSDDVMCRREWVNSKRHLRDLTKGTIGGGPYWRSGLLGYSTIDERYEWVTIDGVNANMMIYLGEPGSGLKMPISMSGTFTDQGVIGEDTVGEQVGQRTVISIESEDRHVIDLYFTPPGQEEFLAAHMVYTRMAE